MHPDPGDRIFAPLALFAASTVSCAGVPKVEAFDDGERFGYRGTDGGVVIAPQYLLAGPFTREGLACVAIEGRGFAWIRSDGSVVFDAEVVDNDCDAFSTGSVRLARVRVGGKLGFMDRRGALAIPAEFDWGAPFERGSAQVCVGCTREAVGEHTRYVGGEWWTIDGRGQPRAR